MANYSINLILSGKNQVGNIFQQAANDANKLKTTMNSAASGMGTGFTSAFNKIKAEAQSLGSSLKSTFSGIGGLITSLFAGLSLSEMVKSAGDAESKWNRIAAYTGTTSGNLTEQKAEIKAIADQYGVVNGELSSVYETNLRFFGDQQKSAKYTAGIAATSKTTGQDMVTIQNAIMSGELGRNKALQRSVLTEEQRNKYLADGEITQEEIGEILQENEEIVAKNPDLINDANSAWNRMKTSTDKLTVSLGNALLPIVESLTPIVTGIADTFTQLNKDSGGLLGIFTGIGLAAAAIATPLGMAWPALSGMASAAKTVAEKIWSYVDGLNAANKVPKTSPTGGGTVGGGTGSSSKGGIIPLATNTLMGVLGGGVAGDVLSNYVVGPAFSSISSALGGGTPFKSYHGLLDMFGMGNTGYKVENYNEQITANAKAHGANLNNNWNPLDALFPKTATAAGSGGNKGIMNDILGKDGLLRGTGLDKIKWPTPAQILAGITKLIPKINFKLPTVGQILKDIGDKINPLNWKIPNVGDLLNQTWQKIKDLFWKIPSVGELLGQTWNKIKELWWNIPSLGDVLNAITSRIPAFSWPWGPSSSLSGAVNSVGSRASQLLSQARGPLTDSVVGTMSSRSGVGSGYVSQAMANHFNGVPGFRPIADALSDHLSYSFYYGDGKSDSEVWNSGSCNCYDGAQLLETEASHGFGLDTGLSNGVWDGTSIAHTWATIGGQPFDMAAKLLRGQWNPPSGPNSNFDKLMMDIGPGLEYIGYGGHKYDPMNAITSGGNCFDMSLGVMNMAAAYGLPSEMVWGTYQGNSHVWARVAGRDYDPTRMALERTYNPPPRGPGGYESGGDTFNVTFNGTVYGVDDLNGRTKQMVNSALDERARKKKSRTFGG